MRRVIIASVISALTVAGGTFFGVRHYTHASTVTVYDADVNHDGGVGVTSDVVDVLRFVGQSAPLPTATLTPTASPSATPTPAVLAYTTYVVTKRLDSATNSGYRSEDLLCNEQDEPVGWSISESGGPISMSSPVRVAAADGHDVDAWQFNYEGYDPPTISLVCLVASAGPLPLAHVVASNQFSASSFAVACPSGMTAVGWGHLSDMGGSVAAEVTGNTISGWTFLNSNYDTLYAVCLGSSASYLTPSAYIALACDGGDVATAFGVVGGVECLDNPPAH